MLVEGTILFGVLACSGPGCVTSDSFESFSQLALIKKCSSPPDPKLIDRRPAAGDCRKMPRVSSRDTGHAPNRFHHIVTNDEGWFYLEYQHASPCSVSREEVPQRVNPAIGTAMFMLTDI
jgi:hypothetical protein